MFIAPGCNGIRGAVTLGLAAVVIGYMYRFRWFVYAPVVAGAVLTGYLFNFLRLCLLVVYYKIALPYPWLQQRAKTAATTSSAAACSLRDVPVLCRRQPPAPPPRRRHPGARRDRAAVAPAAPVLRACAVILVLAAIFSVDTVHSYRRAQAQAALRPKLVSFPSTHRRLHADAHLDRDADRRHGRLRVGRLQFARPPWPAGHGRGDLLRHLADARPA